MEKESLKTLMKGLTSTSITRKGEGAAQFVWASRTRPYKMGKGITRSVINIKEGEKGPNKGQ